MKSAIITLIKDLVNFKYNPFNIIYFKESSWS